MVEVVHDGHPHFVITFLPARGGGDKAFKARGSAPDPGGVPPLSLALRGGIQRRRCSGLPPRSASDSGGTPRGPGAEPLACPSSRLLPHRERQVPDPIPHIRLDRARQSRRIAARSIAASASA